MTKQEFYRSEALSNLLLDNRVGYIQFVGYIPSSPYNIQVCKSIMGVKVLEMYHYDKDTDTLEWKLTKTLEPVVNLLKLRDNYELVIEG